MEAFSVFLIFAVGIGILIVAISATVRTNRTVECYTKLAEHYVGTCEPGNLFRRPKVYFHHAGARVTVDVFSTGGEHPSYYTRIQFALPAVTRPMVRCEVYPEGMWSRLGKMFGMDDVEIGAGEFDDVYVIKAADRPQLRELLNPAVQDQIERLRRFLGNNDIYVSFDSRQLLVQKRSYIRDFPQLLRYTELALSLYDTAVRVSDEGIEFVDDDTPVDWSHAICQICGEEIEDDVVFCRRCKTPHHRDCWQYYGACSTYGCREKKYLRPDSRRAQREQRRM